MPINSRDVIHFLKMTAPGLASIDAKVESDNAIAVLLKNMPIKYDSPVTTLTHQPNPTWEGCEAALLEEEQKIKRRNDSNASTRPRPRSKLFFHLN